MADEEGPHDLVPQGHSDSPALQNPSPPLAPQNPPPPQTHKIL